ncbi:GNAT family N-acetyltransferase [Bradymonas sediminis]|uniref:Uncharacterized protein n=1 Tax=Bradymonas sediminis TaxID=1548548 RepID=A0A2Z4FH15_9DELT|nr:GNAT family N-acetyltransferase [Bradymonas sediminis]AWV88219.1 hypothetical protein DN745_02235 [Bradymonas sediminis]TDP77341.1 acetyltransferase (GNAT) family protein [Bradymonas sediminis]
MLRLDTQQFKETIDAFDAQVAQTPDIDRFCSASCWILPAFETLSSEHQLWAWKATQTDGYVALCKGSHPRVGRYLQPLEASWGLASPIVGKNVAAVTDEFIAQAREISHSWDILFLTGISETSPQFEALVRGFQVDHFMGIGPSMGRQFASIEDGLEGYLSRRSSKFRANIRREMRRANQMGVQFEYLNNFKDAQECLEVFERIIRIEHRSWKGREGAGITHGRMYEFYRSMLPRLAEKGALRVLFGTVDGVDIAYGFGGIFQNTYRGLQMSFDQDYHDISPGNLAQIEMIQCLARDGVEIYDMGQSMDYKSSWTDAEFETVAVIVRK